MQRLRPRRRPSRSLVSLALAAAFLLVAAACGDSGDSTTTGDPAPTDAVDQPQPIGPAADGPLPAVDVVDVASGANVSLTSYNTGQRPLLVWFWAPH